MSRAQQKTVKVKAIPCEVYSRVVGYYRPVSSWNDGKQKEFEERKYLKIKLPVQAELKTR